MAVEPNPTSPTLGELRARLRAALADRQAWPDHRLDQWIGEALSAYSAYFPYQASLSIPCEAGERRYLLNERLAGAPLLGVTQVEFPAGGEPRRFLARRAERDAGFFGGPYYDLGLQNTQLEYTYGAPPLVYLVLGETPQAGQSLWAAYETAHQLPASSASALSVPAPHLELLRLYVTWQAAAQLELDEAVSVHGQPERLAALGEAARRAAEHYRLGLAGALRQAAPSAAAEWALPGGRVY